jgi:hypothetical protein
MNDDAEWLELHARMEQLSAEQTRALLLEWGRTQGRIPTPADDGLSSELARLIDNDEHIMQTRVGVGLWQWLLTTLRARQG